MNTKKLMPLTALVVAINVFPVTNALANDIILDEIDDVLLDVIVVTAQRRTENIKDVPIAVTVATHEQMEIAGVKSFKDIAMLSSGIQVNDSNNFIFPFIRGIGSFVQSGSTNSSIAVYLDGIYLPRLSATALELDNVQKIEILKGPQATLYGRNATGGTIKITTKTAVPSDVLEGRASVTVGDFQNRRVSFFVSGGLSESFAANISGYSAKRDGFNKNLAAFNQDVTDGSAVKGKDLDNLDAQYFNAKLTWAPNDDLRATLSAYTGDYDGTAGSGLRQLDPASALGYFSDTAAQLSATAADPATPPAIATGLIIQAAQFTALAGSLTFPTKDRQLYSHSDRTRNKTKGVSLMVDYDAKSLEFKSITAGNWIESNASADIIGANIATFGFEGVTDSRDFSQELQLSSIDDNGIDWMIGANYFKEQSDDFEDLVGIQFGTPGLTSRVDWSAEAKSYFAEIYYSLTDALSVTLGTRYTNETFEGTPVIDVNADPAAISIKETVDDDGFTYRAVLDYSTDWGLIYGSVSTGFKSGGLVTANIGSGPYDAEELTAFEIGTKATLAGGKVQLNAAAFLYDFTHIQSQLVGGPTGGAVFFVSGDEADLSGVELEILSQVNERLAVQAGITYLIDHEYVDFNIPANASVMTPAVNASGNDMVGAAELTAVLGVQYTVPISNIGALTSSVNANYNSGSYHDLENLVGTGGLDDDSYTVMNARLSFLNISESTEIALWVNNFTDEHYYRSGLVALQGATKLGLENQPRHYGATLSYNF